MCSSCMCAAGITLACSWFFQWCGEIWQPAIPDIVCAHSPTIRQAYIACYALFPCQFLGDPSNYTHVNTWSTTYYNNSVTALNKYAWINNAVCTTAYPSICEIPKSYFDCPTSPPPAPPPSPYNFGLCECLALCCCHKLPVAIMSLRSSAWAAVAWITNARSTCTLAWCICLPHMASSSNCATAA